jgi:hypothetical protein
MENGSENFDQLRKLLALKKHEQPPPGYFNRLPGEIISRIRAEQSANSPAGRDANAPWLLRMWRALESKPAFAGAFGLGVCALVVTGIFFAEKPDASTGLAGGPSISPQPVAPFATASTIGASAAPALPDAVLAGVTNPAGNTVAPNLFDLYQPGQAMPASASGLR